MRLNLDAYFLRIAEVVATRSTCLRRQIGAVLVKEKRIISTGYNGVPENIEHCRVCARANVPSGQRSELCRAAHAEQNAINFAARFGIAIDGAMLYTTHYPCSWCAKSIVNSGIKRVVYSNPYPDELTKEILQNIEVIHDTD